MKNRAMKNLYLVLSAVSLAVCLAAPFLFFWGSLSLLECKQLLAVASVGWFVCATAWVSRRRGAR